MRAIFCERANRWIRFGARSLVFPAFLLPMIIASYDARGAEPLDDLLEKHRQAIKALGDFRASVLGEIAETGGGFKLMSTVNWVRAQNADRFTSQTHLFLNAKQETVRIDDPKHVDLSFDETEVRVLRNWNPNPEEKVELPLRPGGRHAKVFASRKGSIVPLDPAHPPSNVVLAWLLFNPDVVHDFATFVRESGAATVAGDDAHPIIEIKAPDGARRYTLSAQHGYLLSRAEWFNSEGEIRAKVEITEFFEARPGVWFPKQSLSYDHDKPKIRATVVKSAFGAPIPKNEAIVQFPHGARVDKPVEKVICIWGPDGRPERTFTDPKEFEAWEDQAARANQPVSGGMADNRSGNFLWIINVALLVGIAILFVIRKLIRKPTA